MTVPHVLFLAACLLPSSAGTLSPLKCIETKPDDTYTRTEEFLTFVATQAQSPYHLRLSEGSFTGDYPDCLSFNGTRVKEFGAVGKVLLDAEQGVGTLWAEFNGTIMPEAGRGPLTGHFVIESNNDWLDLHTVPFMRNGASTNFVQHGCSKQGEPGFPQLKAYFSSWGHANVWLNGKMLYERLWVHTMFTNRMREQGSNAIWADKAHTKPFNPARCWEGDVQDDKFEYSLVLARNCRSSDPHQVHPTTDVNIALSFMGVEQISGQSIDTGVWEIIHRNGDGEEVGAVNKQHADLTGPLIVTGSLGMSIAAMSVLMVFRCGRSPLHEQPLLD